MKENDYWFQRVWFGATPVTFKVFILLSSLVGLGAFFEDIVNLIAKNSNLSASYIGGMLFLITIAQIITILAKTNWNPKA